MYITHILYVTSAAIAICACIPQLRKLIEGRQSDELSLTTWVTWLIAQAVSIAYAISVQDVLYAVVSSLWFGFYALMVVLIIKYRKVSPVPVAVE